MPEKDKYAGYYAERQFGTRGPDEREQGADYGAEEEHYAPHPSDAWGRPSSDEPVPGPEAASVSARLRAAGQRLARTVKRVLSRAHG